MNPILSPRNLVHPIGGIVNGTEADQQGTVVASDDQQITFKNWDINPKLKAEDKN